MTATEQKKIKAQLTKALKSRGFYQKETDDILIETVIFNLELIREAKAEISKRGQMVNIGKDKDFYQINFSVSIFDNSVKSIDTILKQLGLDKLEVENDPRNPHSTN
jgi:hypothetical protein